MHEDIDTHRTYIQYMAEAGTTNIFDDSILTEIILIN